MGKCEGKCELDKKNRELRAKDGRIEELETVSKSLLSLAHRPMRRECFTFESGDVLLEWPRDMSTVEHEEFSRWLSLIQHKIERQVSEGSHPALEAARNLTACEGDDVD